MSRSAAAFRQCLVWGLGVAAGVLVCGLIATEAPAESVDSFVGKLVGGIRHRRIQKVLLVVRPADGELVPDAPPPEIGELRQQIIDACHTSGIKLVELEPDEDFPAMSLGALPDPGDLVNPLNAVNADAAITISWKGNSAGVSTRAGLLSHRKVFSNSRTNLAPARTTKVSKTKGPTGAFASTGSNGYSQIGPQPFPGFGSSFGGGPSWSGAGSGGFSNGGFSTGGLSTGIPSTGGLSSGGLATGGLASGGASLPPLPVFNQEILAYAENKLGQQVGNGQCYALAQSALQYAGAKPPQGLTFGAQVALTDLFPGDILHFHTARFVTAWNWWILGGPDHVAIVGDVSGTRLEIYQQNINNVLLVRKDVIDLTSLVSGTVTGFRAIEKPKPLPLP